MEQSGGKKWLAYGCFGCLGLLGIVALLLALVAAIGAFQARSERIVEKDFTRTPAALSEPVPDGAPAHEVRGAGRVVLELHQGNEFSIKPVATGEPLRVSAKFDESTYTLTETLEEPPDRPWVYTVVFERHGSRLTTAIKELISGNRPEVEILLPEGVPIELDVRAEEGGLIADLGGLWLTQAEFDLDKAGLVLDVSRPLARPVDRMTFDASMAGLVLDSLGNASPRELAVDVYMGGLNVDLDGEWVADSDISFRLRMGGGRVELPKNVRIEGLEDRGIGSMERPEIAPPTLRFTVDGNRDDIRFER